MKSRIDASVDYAETKQAYGDDEGSESIVYDIKGSEGNDIEVAVGHEHLPVNGSKKVVFFSIYEVKETGVVPIGVYEMESTIAAKKNYLDEDGDIDIDKLGTPLFYGESPPYPLPVPVVQAVPEPEPEPVHIPDAKPEPAKPTKPTKPTKESVLGEAANWFQDFTEDSDYQIHDNEGGGDCLFAAIRDALQSSGTMTSVKDLRAILAAKATPEIFEQYYTLYIEMKENMDSVKSEFAILSAENEKLKQDFKEAVDMSEQRKILRKGDALKKRLATLKEDRRLAINLFEEYKFMKGVDSIGAFRDVIKTCKFWGETWAISTLERALNVKLVLFSEEMYAANDLPNVLQCGQVNDAEMQEIGSFEPEHYILLSYTGYHYKYISYKGQTAFTFKEIPQQIKELIVTRCLETLGGPFALIPQFVDLRLSATKGSIKSVKASASATKLTAQQDADYDPNTIFMFYYRSAAGPKPGKGSGEKIPTPRISEFRELAKHKDWRRKLSNDWEQVFELDGHNWLSVDHYYEANKFKMNHPDYYYQFSMDSGSELSKNAQMAKAAGSPSGKWQGKRIRPSGIEADMDFFGVRAEDTKRRAQRAKFTQNKDLRKVLKDTKDAVLMHYQPRQEPIMYIMLMNLRKNM